jgi:L-threonylcarbamoyladenylate synthase
MKLNIKDKNSHKKAAQIVKEGGIAIVPTDTVYGFVADAFNMKAQKKIYKIKGRLYKKPLVIMAHKIECVQMLVDIPQNVLSIAKKFWPGQLTLI